MGTSINCRESRFYRDTRPAESRQVGVNEVVMVRNNGGVLMLLQHYQG